MKQKKGQKRRRRNRRYDSAFKTNALALVNSGRSVGSVADSLGIDKSLLYAWRRQAEPMSEVEKAELDELDHLRHRVLELEQERDILKKALAIFSRPVE